MACKKAHGILNPILHRMQTQSFLCLTVSSTILILILISGVFLTLNPHPHLGGLPTIDIVSTNTERPFGGDRVRGHIPVQCRLPVWSSLVFGAPLERSSGAESQGWGLSRNWNPKSSPDPNPNPNSNRLRIKSEPEDYLCVTVTMFPIMVMVAGFWWPVHRLGFSGGLCIGNQYRYHA